MAAQTAVPPSTTSDRTPAAAGAAAAGAASKGTAVTIPSGAGVDGGVVTGAAALTAAGPAAVVACRGGPDATFGDDACGALGLDTVGWATGVGRAVPGLFECRKSRVTYTVPPLTMIPTPTWLKAGSMMFSRWWGLFKKASWIDATSPPMPTFSPSELALSAARLPWDTKLPCQIVPACAISTLWDTAMLATSARHCRAATPPLARAPLVRSKNWAAASFGSIADGGGGVGAGGAGGVGVGAGGGGVGAGGAVVGGEVPEEMQRPKK